jgi:hypothetical protein
MVLRGFRKWMWGYLNYRINQIGQEMKFFLCKYAIYATDCPLF